MFTVGNDTFRVYEDRIEHQVTTVYPKNAVFKGHESGMDLYRLGDWGIMVSGDQVAAIKLPKIAAPEPPPVFVKRPVVCVDPQGLYSIEVEKVQRNEHEIEQIVLEVGPDGYDPKEYSLEKHPMSAE